MLPHHSLEENAEFVFDTDACLQAMIGVLLQQIEGRDYVLAKPSPRLSGTTVPPTVSCLHLGRHICCPGLAKVWDWVREDHKPTTAELEVESSEVKTLVGRWCLLSQKRDILTCTAHTPQKSVLIVQENIDRSMESKGRQRIRCQADKFNLHNHNPFPDIIGNKQHIHNMKISTSLPCRNHKSCVHIM